MAKMLYDITPKMGRVIPVENLKKKWNEVVEYLSLKIEDEDGGKERYIMFTVNEYDTCPIVDSIDLPKFKFDDKDIERYKTCKEEHAGRIGKNMLEEMKSGRLYRTIVQDTITKQDRVAYLIETDVYSPSRKEFFKIVIRISPTKLKSATARAKRNPEDIAVVSWFQDLCD